MPFRQPGLVAHWVLCSLQKVMQMLGRKQLLLSPFALLDAPEGGMIMHGIAVASLMVGTRIIVVVVVVVLIIVCLLFFVVFMVSLLLATALRQLLKLPTGHCPATSGKTRRRENLELRAIRTC